MASAPSTYISSNKKAIQELNPDFQIYLDPGVCQSAGSLKMEPNHHQKLIDSSRW